MGLTYPRHNFGAALHFCLKLYKVGIVIGLDSHIEEVLRISRRIIPALRRLGIKTLRHLLFYFPTRYEDFSNFKLIKDISLNETVTIQGEIKRVSNIRTARKKMFLTEAVIEDGSGKIRAVWFNQPYLLRNLKAGSTINLSGKMVLGPKGLYLQNPAYEKVDFKQETTNDQIHTGGLVAIYPETEGISSRWLRYLIRSFIDLRKQIPEPLPRDILAKYKFPKITDAILAIHFPKSKEEAEAAEHRFIFENLFYIQIRALLEKIRIKSYGAPQVQLDVALLKKFVKGLPFSLTNAQRRSIWEIAQDISHGHPMNRLLEGDVGSGKTVVAAAAALLTVKSGYKTVFMAPTEILAKQHFNTLEKLLTPFKVTTGLLTGSEKKTSHDPGVVVGTHALIQKNVTFDKLGLVVVDEQHRFGVEQRAKLTKSKQQGDNVPHFLSMSATPIPRTLALTVYGDLDLSILDEMPRSRKKIITQIVEPHRRAAIYQFIKDEVARGKQVFVICPRIESRDTATHSLSQQQLLIAEVKTVKEEFKKLSSVVFPSLKIGMLHGRLKSKEKAQVMDDFKNGKIDLLISTSVVEVGVDIPNATIMMIEGAERFGLAQLHQFRGRVGRGEDQSYCFLFPSEDGMVTKRLKALVESHNGFELAEKDLEIRGPGDIFGNKQWGDATKVMKGMTDAALVREVRKEAYDLIKKDPALRAYPAIKEKARELKETIHWE